ncbi:MAG TPA: hypothetical protein ENJ18_01295, partial [Nannocystis exedens]|nr:hypothetical protein [Nannocystis exedens]
MPPMKALPWTALPAAATIIAMHAPRPWSLPITAARSIAALILCLAVGCPPPQPSGTSAEDPKTEKRPGNPSMNKPMNDPTKDDGATSQENTETQAGSLTTEDVARYPQPGMLQPSHLAFSPDDRLITYLRSADASLRTELYAFDPKTGSERLLAHPPGGGETEENLSREEKLRRERQRIRGLGITRYSWTHHQAKTPRMLVPVGGGIFVLDPPENDGDENNENNDSNKASEILRELVAPGDKPALDPSLSRDGEQVAYVYDDELYVVPTVGGTPRQLSHGARGSGRSHGLAEYIAQEEMGRNHGYWWSRNGDWIAYTEVDETQIPSYQIVHQGKDTTGPEAIEEHRYPFAGADNA